MSAPGPRCRDCGAALGERQRWCLECGAAPRIAVETTANWARTAAASVIVAIVVLAALGYGLAALAAS